MENISAVFYFLMIVPGILQLVTFFILFGICSWMKRFTGHRLPASLIATGILLTIVNVTAPYWVLAHLLISAVGLFFWKASTRTQIIAPVIATVIFGFSYYEMAEVQATFPSTAVWHIGDKGQPESGNPPEHLVELKFGDTHDQIEGRYSDQLADYLNAKNSPSIPVSLPIYYRWGIAHAMGPAIVDGKEFPANSGGYGDWSADRPNAPIPKYYFGLRHFTE